MKRIISKSALGIVLLLSSVINIDSFVEGVSIANDYIVKQSNVLTEEYERGMSYNYALDNFIGSTPGVDENIENDYDTLTENAIIERSPILVGEGTNNGFNEYYDVPFLASTGGSLDLRINPETLKIETRINTFPDSMIEFQALDENKDDEWKIKINAISTTNSIDKTNLTYPVAYSIVSWEKISNKEWIEIEVEEAIEEAFASSELIYVEIFDYTNYLEHVENPDIPGNVDGAGIWTTDWRVQPIRFSLKDNYYQIEKALQNTAVSEMGFDSNNSIFSFYIENDEGDYEIVTDKNTDTNTGRFNVRIESFIEELNNHGKLWFDEEYGKFPVIEFYSYYDGGVFNFSLKMDSSFVPPEEIVFELLSISYIRNYHEWNEVTTIGAEVEITDEQSEALNNNEVIFQDISIDSLNWFYDFVNKQLVINYMLSIKSPSLPSWGYFLEGENSGKMDFSSIGTSDIIEYNLPYVDDFGIDWKEENDSNQINFDWEISEEDHKVVNVDASLNNDATIWFTTDNKETPEEVEFKVVDDSNWLSEATTIREGEEATKYSYEISSSEGFVFESNGYTFNMDVHYGDIIEPEVDNDSKLLLYLIIAGLTLLLALIIIILILLKIKKSKDDE